MVRFAVVLMATVTFAVNAQVPAAVNAAGVGVPDQA